MNKPNKITNLRPFVRTRLTKYPKLHQTSILLHQNFCSATGWLHTLPDFIIIGAARCGTTSLYEYLMQHPDIYQGVGKEIHYFEQLYKRGINWYKVCFPLKIQKFFINNILRKRFLTGEATPRYLDHPAVPKRIQKLIPNVKLIVLLRNPIDRTFSHYAMNVKNGFEKLEFEQAIKNETERVKEAYEFILKTNEHSLDYYLYAYLERSTYVNKIRRWFEVFPKEQIMIIQSEEFFSNPSKIYNKVLKFLNLPRFELPEYKKRMGGQYKKNSMDPDTRKKLSDYFRPHNEELNRLLGINFDWDK